MNWETIITMAGKLATETTSKYGPVAWDMLLWITRMDALSYLVPEIAIGLVAVLYLRWYFKFNLPALRTQRDADNVKRIENHYSAIKTLDDYARFWVTL